jgi:hypothetical protein
MEAPGKVTATLTAYLGSGAEDHALLQAANKRRSRLHFHGMRRMIE